MNTKRNYEQKRMPWGRVTKKRKKKEIERSGKNEKDREGMEYCFEGPTEMHNRAQRFLANNHNENINCVYIYINKKKSLFVVFMFMWCFVFVFLFFCLEQMNVVCCDFICLGD